MNNQENKEISDIMKQTRQEELYSPEGREPIVTFDPTVTFEFIRNRMHKFVDERDWHKFHKPRNLILALTGEVGELAEIFQWRGEVEVGLPDFTPEEKIHVGEEIADCILYLTRISQQCGVDLPKAILDKMEKNAKKYPSDKFHGSSAKYNTINQNNITSENSSVEVSSQLSKAHTRITYMVDKENS